MDLLISWIVITAVVCGAYGFLIRKIGKRIKPGSWIHKYAMQFADWVDLDVATGRRKPFDAE